MTEQKEITTNNDSFELSIYKFMNYSSSSTFYLILTISSFFSVMTLNNLFSIRSVKETPAVGFLQPLFLIVAGTLIGLLLWRLAINRIESKASLRKAIVYLGKDTSNNNRKFVDALNLYKKIAIEKLRKIRLFSSIVVAMYMLFLTASIVETLSTSKPLDFFIETYIIYYTLIIAGILTSIITTIFINKKFNKYLNENHETTEEENKVAI